MIITTAFYNASIKKIMSILLYIKVYKRITYNKKNK